MSFDFTTQPNSQLPPRSKPKISIKDTSGVVCDKCQNNTFMQAMYMRKVSPLITGTGKPMYIPVEQAIVCTKCGHCNDEFIPLEFKTDNLLVP